MVNVSVETPPGAMAAGANALAMDGGATTKMLAEAVPPVATRNTPVPSSNVPVILPLTLFLVPAAVPFTFTENEQEAAAARLRLLRLMVPLPAAALIVE